MERYTIELLKPAELEIKEACAWYEKQRQGLAAELLTEVSYYFDRIAEDPYLFIIHYNKNHRIAILNRFPYLIVFRVSEEKHTIYVNSFFHTSRNPIKFNKL